MSKINAKFPCSQKDFYSAASTAWRNFLLFLVNFSSLKALYKTATATAALAALDEANAMADVKQRNEASERAREEMIPLAEACIDLFVRLKRYIDTAYTENLRHIMYESAGQQYYEQAQNEDWDSIKMMSVTMKKFIEEHDVELEANENMPKDDFLAEVIQSGIDFNNKFEDYKVYSETGVATGDKLKALNACYDTMNDMLKDGKAIFRKDETKQALFVFANILAAINPTKAAIGVLVQDADTDEGIKTAVVSVKYPNEPVIMLTVNSDGYLSEELKGGTPIVTVMAPDYIPESQTLDIPTGKTVKLDVKLKKAA
ncbi:MAG: hypothetical protein ABI723_20830 [Bacteroidia bacterium]